VTVDVPNIAKKYTVIFGKNPIFFAIPDNKLKLQRLYFYVPKFIKDGRKPKFTAELPRSNSNRLIFLDITDIFRHHAKSNLHNNGQGMICT